MIKLPPFGQSNYGTTTASNGLIKLPPLPKTAFGGTPTAEQIPEISGRDKFMTEKFPGTLQTLSELQTDTLGLKSYKESLGGKTAIEKVSNVLGFNLVGDAEKNIAKTIADSITGGAEKIGGLLSSVGIKNIKWSNILKGKSPIEMGTTPQSAAGITGKALEAGAGLAGAALSPISALFSEGAKLPIVGTPVKLVNLAFGAAGEGGVALFNKGLNIAIDTKLISKENADKIRQGGSEISALTAQLLLGGLAYKGSLESRLKGAYKEGIKNLPEGTPPPPPPSVPFTYGLKAGETYKITEGIHPLIADIVKAKPELQPLVEQVAPQKVDELINKFGEQDAKTIIQVTAEVAQKQKEATPKQEVSGTPEIPKKLEEFEPKGISKELEPKGIPAEAEIKYEPTIGVSGLAKSVKSKAIRDKMIYGFDKRFRELPEYDKNITAEKAAKSTDYVLNNPEEAVKVAMGEKAAPEGLFPEDVYVAVDEYATNIKDVEIIRRLATESKLVGEATQMGQRIQTLSRLNPDSAVGRIQELKEFRGNKAVKGTRKTTSEVAKEIKNETQRILLPREVLNWNKFLEEITC